MIYILYTHQFNENSGGSSLFFILCDFLKKNLGKDNFYIAPLFCKGDGLIDRGFIKLHNMNENDFEFDKYGNSLFPIDLLKDEYFEKDNYNIPQEYKKYLVTREILNTKQNVAIYPEGILGNPLQQKFVIRWILYFTTPGLSVVPQYPWGKKDKFVFWCKSYFKNKETFYRGISDGQIRDSDYYPEEKDVLFLKYLFVHDKIDLNYKKSNVSRNGSCYLIRKADPNYNRTFGTNWNDGIFYNENHPYMKPKPPVFIHPQDSICIDSYGLNDLTDIFKKTEIFYCYDLFTFHNCIALLYGCKVVMCIPEGKLSKEDWHCGDECYLDYVAWGDSKEELDKAENALKNINYGDIIKNIQNKFSHEFNDVYEKLESYFSNVKQDFFEESVGNSFFYGTNYKEISCKNSEDYTKNFSSKFWEIEADFIISEGNNDYANIFDMNFNKINYGPRLEYQEGNLVLIIGNENGFMGFRLSENILCNEKYQLKISLESTSLIINFNGVETKYNVVSSPNFFENSVLGKGFNEERYFKGFVEKFRVVIY
jgi:hypothetical protein